MKHENDMEQLDQDITTALLEAGSWRKDTVQREIAIKRGERIAFTFKVEPLDEDVWRRCRRQNMKNKGKRTAELDDSRFASQIVYEATCDDDKARLWKNPEVWRKLNATSGIDVVDYILKPSERFKIAEVISDISGYEDDDNLDGLIRNL